MNKLFFQNIARHIELDTSEELYLKSKLQFKTVSKNEELLRTGDICRNIYFVNTGCLRIYKNHENGEQTNVLFCPENWWACDIISFSTGTPSTYSIAALENGQIIGIDFKELEEIYAEIPKLERFFRILLQNGFALYQNRLTLALSASAEIRFSVFNIQYPMLINRISQKHVASYLGITPVFLSMIRKRLINSKDTL